MPINETATYTVLLFSWFITWWLHFLYLLIKINWNQPTINMSSTLMFERNLRETHVTEAQPAMPETHLSVWLMILELGIFQLDSTRAARVLLYFGPAPSLKLKSTSPHNLCVDCDFLLQCPKNTLQKECCQQILSNSPSFSPSRIFF